MTQYFNVNPSLMVFENLPSGSLRPGTLFSGTIAGPERIFTRHSDLVRQAITADKPMDYNLGELISPQYDSEEWLDQSSVNPMTNPRMSALDRFEYAMNYGKSAIEAASFAKVGVSTAPAVDASSPDSTTE